MINNVKTAVVQFNHRPGDKRYNLDCIEKMCRRAAMDGCRIIAFPEMCITGYWHIRNLSRGEIARLAEPIPSGESISLLQNLSRELNLIIGVGLIEESRGELYNSYAVVQPDRPVAHHRKLHCFISEHLESGDQYTVVETSLGVKLGILICWDNNLGENTRITALKGADILLAPHQTGGCRTNSPYVMGAIDVDLWEDRKNSQEALRREFQGKKGRGWLMRWLPARAHDNGLFLLFSNGVGRDDDEVRTGNAMIIDCNGEIITESAAIDDDIVTAELDLTLLDSSLGRNWIRGRRPELYSPLTGKSDNLLDIRTLKELE